MSTQEVIAGGVIDFGGGPIQIIPFLPGESAVSDSNVFDVEQALRQVLLAAVGVTAVCGDRVYPGYLPQGLITWPALAYKVQGRTKELLVEPGVQTVAKTEVHMYCLSNSANAYGETKRLSEAVRLCLEGYVGLVVKTGSDPEESVDILGIFFDTHEDHDDPLLKLRQANSVFQVWHNQT